MTWRHRALALAPIALALSLSAFAAPSDDASLAVAVAGQVQHPSTLTIEDLRKLPSDTVAISFETDRGTDSATYTGVLLWTVVNDAAPVDAPGRNTYLRHTFLVTGRDGYAVSISEGEINPKFEGKSVLLAYEQNGEPLDPKDGIRLLVPGDIHGGRAVRDVVKIEVQ